jgi:subtilisin family serine protease
VYSHALQGYAARLPTTAIPVLAADARVASIELDGIMHADTTQTGATWGIDRIDQRSLPTNGSYSYTATGAGVKAYIIDTGIHFSHNDFGGRAIHGTDKVTATGGILGIGAGGGSTNGEDCNGHGTHVSGTVGGATYGVAKQVTLVAVRVLDCGGSGATSGVIAGVDWVTADRQAHPTEGAIANMSLGSSAFEPLDIAIRGSILAGRVSYAVAAGNDGADACNYSPARTPEAMTIGASDSSDAQAGFSNRGSCVDWYAPGVGVLSSWYTSNTATATLNGTSMATPHVAGVAALYLQGNPLALASDVTTALSTRLTQNVVTGVTTSNNDLLFTDF